MAKATNALLILGIMTVIAVVVAITAVGPQLPASVTGGESFSPPFNPDPAARCRTTDRNDDGDAVSCAGSCYTPGHVCAITDEYGGAADCLCLGPAHPDYPGSSPSDSQSITDDASSF